MTYLQQCVLDEISELDTKAIALSYFIDSDPAFATLNSQEQSLLRDQRSVMWAYAEILDKRIECFRTPNE